jgi:acetyltransferase-like isoleucine patch superfamily enzyme
MLFAKARNRAIARLLRTLPGGPREIDVADSVRVRVLGLFRSPPSRLVIGVGSIVYADIRADRPGAQVIIGARTFIGRSTLVAAERIVIGDDVLISSGCHIVDHDSHSIVWEERAQDVTDWGMGRKNWVHVRVEPVIVRAKAWIGIRAMILRGVTVGEGAIVGGGSVVTRDVPPFTIVAGNPARVIRQMLRN